MELTCPISSIHRNSQDSGETPVLVTTLKIFYFTCPEITNHKTWVPGKDLPDRLRIESKRFKA